MRVCEGCGSKMPPFTPRHRNEAGKLVCAACASGRPGGGGVIAAKGGDASPIYHSGDGVPKHKIDPLPGADRDDPEIAALLRSIPLNWHELPSDDPDNDTLPGGVDFSPFHKIASPLHPELYERYATKQAHLGRPWPHHQGHFCGDADGDGNSDCGDDGNSGGGSLSSNRAQRRSAARENGSRPGSSRRRRQRAQRKLKARTAHSGPIASPTPWHDEANNGHHGVAFNNLYDHLTAPTDPDDALPMHQQWAQDHGWSPSGHGVPDQVDGVDPLANAWENPDGEPHTDAEKAYNWLSDHHSALHGVGNNGPDANHHHGVEEHHTDPEHTQHGHSLDNLSDDQHAEIAAGFDPKAFADEDWEQKLLGTPKDNSSYIPDPAKAKPSKHSKKPLNMAAAFSHLGQHHGLSEGQIGIDPLSHHDDLHEQADKQGIDLGHTHHKHTYAEKNAGLVYSPEKADPDSPMPYIPLSDPKSIQGAAGDAHAQELTDHIEKHHAMGVSSGDTSYLQGMHDALHSGESPHGNGAHWDGYVGKEHYDKGHAAGTAHVNGDWYDLHPNATKPTPHTHEESKGIGPGGGSYITSPTSPLQHIQHLIGEHGMSSTLPDVTDGDYEGYHSKLHEAGEEGHQHTNPGLGIKYKAEPGLLEALKDHLSGSSHGIKNLNLNNPSDLAELLAKHKFTHKFDTGHAPNAPGAKDGHTHDPDSALVTGKGLPEGEKYQPDYIQAMKDHLSAHTGGHGYAEHQIAYYGPGKLQQVHNEAHEYNNATHSHEDNDDPSQIGPGNLPYPYGSSDTKYHLQGNHAFTNDQLAGLNGHQLVHAHHAAHQMDLDHAHPDGPSDASVGDFANATGLLDHLAAHPHNFGNGTPQQTLKNEGLEGLANLHQSDHENDSDVQEHGHEHESYASPLAYEPTKPDPDNPAPTPSKPGEGPYGGREPENWTSHITYMPPTSSKDDAIEHLKAHHPEVTAEDYSNSSQYSGGGGLKSWHDYLHSSTAAGEGQNPKTSPHEHGGPAAKPFVPPTTVNVFDHMHDEHGIDGSSKSHKEMLALHEHDHNERDDEEIGHSHSYPLSPSRPPYSFLPNPEHEDKEGYEHLWYHGTPSSYSGVPMSAPENRAHPEGSGSYGRFDVWDCHPGANWSGLHGFARSFGGSRVIAGKMRMKNPAKFQTIAHMGHDAYDRLRALGEISDDHDRYDDNHQGNGYNSCGCHNVLMSYSKGGAGRTDGKIGMKAYRDSLRASGYDGVMARNQGDSPHGNWNVFPFSRKDVELHSENFHPDNPEVRNDSSSYSPPQEFHDGKNKIYEKDPNLPTHIPEHIKNGNFGDEDFDKPGGYDPDYDSSSDDYDGDDDDNDEEYCHHCGEYGHDSDDPHCDECGDVGHDESQHYSYCPACEEDTSHGDDPEAAHEHCDYCHEENGHGWGDHETDDHEDEYGEKPDQHTDADHCPSCGLVSKDLREATHCKAPADAQWHHNFADSHGRYATMAEQHEAGFGCGGQLPDWDKIHDKIQPHEDQMSLFGGHAKGHTPGWNYHNHIAEHVAFDHGAPAHVFQKDEYGEPDTDLDSWHRNQHLGAHGAFPDHTHDNIPVHPPMAKGSKGAAMAHLMLAHSQVSGKGLKNQTFDQLQAQHDAIHDNQPSYAANHAHNPDLPAVKAGSTPENLADHLKLIHGSADLPSEFSDSDTRAYHDALHHHHVGVQMTLPSGEPYRDMHHSHGPDGITYTKDKTDIQNGGVAPAQAAALKHHLWDTHGSLKEGSSWKGLVEEHMRQHAVPNPFVPEHDHDGHALPQMSLDGETTPNMDHVHGDHANIAAHSEANAITQHIHAHNYADEEIPHHHGELSITGDEPKMHPAFKVTGHQQEWSTPKVKEHMESAHGFQIPSDVSDAWTNRLHKHWHDNPQHQEEIGGKPLDHGHDYSGAPIAPVQPYAHATQYDLKSHMQSFHPEHNFPGNFNYSEPTAEQIKAHQKAHATGNGGFHTHAPDPNEPLTTKPGFHDPLLKHLMEHGHTPEELKAKIKSGKWNNEDAVALHAAGHDADGYAHSDSHNHPPTNMKKLLTNPNTGQVGMPPVAADEWELKNHLSASHYIPSHGMNHAEMMEQHDQQHSMDKGTLHTSKPNDVDHLDHYHTGPNHEQPPDVLPHVTMDEPGFAKHLAEHHGEALAAHAAQHGTQPWPMNAEAMAKLHSQVHGAFGDNASEGHKHEQSTAGENLNKHLLHTHGIDPIGNPMSSSMLHTQAHHENPELDAHSHTHTTAPGAVPELAHDHADNYGHGNHLAEYHGFSYADTAELGEDAAKSLHENMGHPSWHPDVTPHTHGEPPPPTPPVGHSPMTELSHDQLHDPANHDLLIGHIAEHHWNGDQDENHNSLMNASHQMLVHNHTTQHANVGTEKAMPGNTPKVPHTHPTPQVGTLPYHPGPKPGGPISASGLIQQHLVGGHGLNHHEVKSSGENIQQQDGGSYKDAFDKIHEAQHNFGLANHQHDDPQAPHQHIHIADHTSQSYANHLYDTHSVTGFDQNSDMAHLHDAHAAAHHVDKFKPGEEHSDASHLPTQKLHVPAAPAGGAGAQPLPYHPEMGSNHNYRAHLVIGHGMNHLEVANNPPTTWAETHEGLHQQGADHQHHDPTANLKYTFGHNHPSADAASAEIANHMLNTHSIDTMSQHPSLMHEKHMLTHKEANYDIQHTHENPNDTLGVTPKIHKEGRGVIRLYSIASAGNPAGIVVVAHDSGDGQTIYHCPFCGSGQVLQRSDKTVECEFCHTSFTVQVQPEYAAFPQTIDGMPVNIPGMPGQIDAPVGAGGGPIGAPGAQPPMDPDALPPGDDGDQDDDGSEDQDDGTGFSGVPSSSNQPPWLKNVSSLSEFDLAAREAIRISGRDPEVIARVKAARKQMVP